MFDFGESNFAKKQFEQLEKMDTTNYPKTPDQVVEIYNATVRYLYSGGASEKKIPFVLEKQRALLSKELISVNPYDTHLEKLKIEIKKFEKSNVAMLDTEILKIDYSDNYKKCKVTTAQIFNIGENKHLELSLIIENECWKIDAFGVQ